MNNIEKIYRLLITNNSASQISRRIGVSKPYIHKIINKLEESGHIVCINPKGKPKHYTKTKKTYTRSKLTKILPTTRPTLDIIEIQKSTFSFNINIEHKIKRKWDKTYIWRKGVQVNQYTYPFKNLGSVIFRQIKSNNVNKLIIILPRINIDKSEIEGIENILIDYAMKCAVWYQKTFKMKVGLPEVIQKPHFAVCLKEPEIIKEVQEGKTFHIGDVMVDKSPPKNLPEFESTDKRDVINYLDSINKIKHIKDMAVENRNLINALADKVEMVVKNQHSILTKLQPKAEIDDMRLDVT
jgi:transposase